MLLYFGLTMDSSLQYVKYCKYFSFSSSKSKGCSLLYSHYSRSENTYCTVNAHYCFGLVLKSQHRLTEGISLGVKG